MRLRVGLLLHNWTPTCVKTGTKGNTDMAYWNEAATERSENLCVCSQEMKWNTHRMNILVCVEIPHEHTCMCGNAHRMNILACVEMLTAWTYLHVWKCSPREHTCMCGNAHRMNILVCVEIPHEHTCMCGNTAWTYLYVWKYSPHEQNWRRKGHTGEDWSAVTTRPFWILDY